MFEKALKGSRLYWGWIGFLILLIIIGGTAYLIQWQQGLTITGMSKEVSWGLYIANFTFLVGVAASAVMVAIPTYIYNKHKFEEMTTLGEFLAVAAVVMCVLFIMVDLGKVERALHVMVYPQLDSVMFFDMVVLGGYGLWNIIIGFYMISSRITNTPDISWYVKIVLFLAIPWAISIHTVTAFLYSGLVARGMWMTALLAPRFLASAFAAGPAFLIIASVVIKKFANYDVGESARRTVAQIVTFAMIVNLFFLGSELFVVFYSQHPEHMAHWAYLLLGHGGNTLVPWIWTSITLGIIAVLLLIHPKTRNNDYYLAGACVLVFVSIWIDKGLGLIVPGYIPSMVHTYVEYWPTVLESLITLGVWGIGLLIFTALGKIAISTYQQYPPIGGKLEEEEVEVPVKKVEEAEEAAPEAAPEAEAGVTFVCGLCEAVFSSKDECCKHAEEAHKISEDQCDMICEEGEGAAPEAEAGVTFVCGLCEAEFSSKDECCEHAEKEHKISKDQCDMICEEE
ncbi:MAG: sulfate reduction electron transfer complex DsrMKJOP subunit DsrP [Archaeoglobaceae archaeon]